MIRLERAAPNTNYIRPVCLPIRDLQNKNYDGFSLTVAGFGKTETCMQSNQEATQNTDDSFFN